MGELKVGERVSVTLEVVENGKCKDCFFGYKDGCPYPCLKSERSDGKNVIYKEVKE